MTYLPLVLRFRIVFTFSYDNLSDVVSASRMWKNLAAFPNYHPPSATPEWQCVVVVGAVNIQQQTERHLQFLISLLPPESYLSQSAINATVWNIAHYEGGAQQPFDLWGNITLFQRLALRSVPEPGSRVYRRAWRLIVRFGGWGATLEWIKNWEKRWGLDQIHLQRHSSQMQYKSPGRQNSVVCSSIVPKTERWEVSFITISCVFLPNYYCQHKWHLMNSVVFNHWEGRDIKQIKPM